ncbi:MAG: prephenate dehydrogenase/arogenate dehydrogenase family protein [Proteobacteria bacterium]|nr:prephenate dehydrogenase/arogenate dehydrogenase family protein [Pseudomonadota bacterium]
MTEEIKKICLVGAGLMGASAAAALKRRSPNVYIEAVDARLKPGSGSDRSDKYRSLRERGWIDAASDCLSTALEQADVLLLALPPGQYAAYLNSFQPKADLLITDAGSVKNFLLDCAVKSWSGSATGLVPAHPMTGAAVSGHAHADPFLYEGRAVFLTPHADSAPWAVARAERFWQQLGATRVERISASAHDRLLSFTSHLPQLVAFALARTATTRQNDAGFNSACGPGLFDSTRLAGSDAALWSEICQYNRENLVAAAADFSRQFLRLSQLIDSGDFVALAAEFDAAAAARRVIEQASTTPAPAVAPAGGESLNTPSCS